MNHQIERIKSKLTQAKSADPDFKVFGAHSHRYQIGEPLSEATLSAFEAKHQIQLPEELRLFYLSVGCGNLNKKNVSAGPFYGIYPLEKLQFFEAKNPCILYPKMSKKDWENLIEPLNQDDISDEDYEKIENEIFGGLLVFNTKGCTYDTAIVLSGAYKGRIVNIDIDYNEPPFFAFENHFLDWYERWLDEVISGELIGNHNSFGETIGGSAEELLNLYETTENQEDKEDYLNALILKKPPLSTEILDKIHHHAQKQNDDFSELVRILARSDFDRAKLHFTALADTNLLSFFQNIFWYAPDKKAESCHYLPLIKTKLAQINDEKTLRFCGYVLQETDTDYAPLMLDFMRHSNPEIRRTAMYHLGKSPNQEKYLENFIAGLQDLEYWVVHSTLQAISLTDERLLPYYQEVALRFKENDAEGYIASNLNHRLKPYGLDAESILKKKFD